MRDFEQDILSAGRFSGILKASDFSWSSARRHLFESCRRAYYFRYYLAQGAWADYVDETARSAYTEKHMMSFHSWLASVFENALRETLRELSVVSPERKRKEGGVLLLRKISRLLSEGEYRLREKSWIDDPKYLNIKELYYGEISIFALMSSAKSILGNVWRIFQASELFQELLSLPSVAFIPCGEFLSFPCRTWRIWLSPGIQYCRKNVFHTLSFSCGEESALCSIAERGSVLQWYAFWKYPHSSACCRVFRFSENSAELLINPESAELETKMLNSVREMLSGVSSDGTVRLADFPRTEDRKVCALCRFRNTCSRIGDL